MSSGSCIECGASLGYTPCDRCDALVARVKGLEAQLTDEYRIAADTLAADILRNEGAARERVASAARIAELERAVAEFQTSPAMAAEWASHGRAAEREAIVAWLLAEVVKRKRCVDERIIWALDEVADDIESGVHLSGDES